MLSFESLMLHIYAPVYFQTISHLFRLGNEKQSVQDQMLNERKQFESELKRVLEQQDRVLRERKGSALLYNIMF